MNRPRDRASASGLLPREGTLSTEAMHQVSVMRAALEALVRVIERQAYVGHFQPEIDAARVALAAAPAARPVAHDLDSWKYEASEPATGKDHLPVAEAAQPAQERKPIWEELAEIGRSATPDVWAEYEASKHERKTLTDEQIDAIADSMASHDRYTFVAAIEKAHGIVEQAKRLP